jgi:hypothetical protein
MATIERVISQSTVPSFRKEPANVPNRDRKRIELPNNSIRFDSVQSNRIESNPKFEKVGRIESSRI